MTADSGGRYRISWRASHCGIIAVDQHIPSGRGANLGVDMTSVNLAFYQAAAVVIPVLFIGQIGQRIFGRALDVRRGFVGELLIEAVLIIYQVLGEVSALNVLARGRPTETSGVIVASALAFGGANLVLYSYLDFVIRPLVEQKRKLREASEKRKEDETPPE